MTEEYLKDDFIFPLIFHNAVEGILATDSEGKIIRANPSCLATFGYAQEYELIGKKVEVLIPGRFHSRHENYRQGYVKSPQFRRMASELELYGLTKKGNQVPLEISLSYVRHQEQLFVICFVVDISEKRALERHKNLAIAEGQENERRRIAQDLHDSIGQSISAINLNLNALEPELDRFNQKFREVYSNLKVQLKETIEEVRAISHNLTPKILEDYGFEKALKYLCDTIDQSTEVDLNLSISGRFSNIDTAITIGLYRMAQELINNALRHARPSSINVEVIRHQEEVVMLVEDDGVGFDVQQTPKGMGLSNIYNRANLLKGTILIDSNEKSGTTVSITVPL